MASGLMTRADFAKLMEPTLRKAFFTTYDKKPLVMPRYWNVQDSYKAKEEIVEVVIPSEVPVAAEGGMYSRSEMLMGRSKTFVHVTRKLEIVMTRELAEDNLYPMALKTQKALAVSMRRTIERVGAQTFSNGLAGEQTPDLKNVFAPDHPVLYPAANNPTSWSNVLAATPFSSDAVKALKVLMRQTRDETGGTTEHEMDQLILPLEYSEEGPEMKGSPGTYDRADRAKNQAGEGLEIIIVPYLQEVTHAWAATAFFGRDSEMAENIWMWRVKPEYELVHEQATGNVIQRVRTRFSCGFVNPRGLVAAYS